MIIDKAKKAYTRFNPEGYLFDEQTGDELIELYPLTLPKPQSYQGNVIREPESSFTAWV